MKTIGLLGGMSWESTTSYYQLINQGIKEKLGGLHSARIILNSIDFAEIEKLQHQDKWAEMATILTQAALSVERAGADFLLICTNTMHKVASEVESAISIPLLHIADATGEALVNDKVQHVALLGTKFTMEQAFYKERLQNKFGLSVSVPDATARDEVHRVIYEELCLGQINDSSKRYYLDVIHSLQKQGAEAVILGCTEIALLVKQTETTMPLYDTATIHAQAAVSASLS